MENHEDFSIFIESINEALPEFLMGIERANPHMLSAQRKFFLKEFEILNMLSQYFPDDSKEKEACSEAINHWNVIDHELAKTPLDIGSLKKDIGVLQNKLLSLVKMTGGDSWMNF